MSDGWMQIDIHNSLRDSFVDTPLSHIINWSGMRAEEFRNYYFTGAINGVCQARPFITDPPFQPWLNYSPVIFPWLGEEFARSLTAERDFFVRWTLRPRTAELERGDANSIVSVYDEATGKIVRNIVYNNGGVCVIAVDFAGHGADASGHWHVLKPGVLENHWDEDASLETQQDVGKAGDWTLCPWVFQAIPSAFQMEPAEEVGR